jgi:hypothetical protein
MMAEYARQFIKRGAYGGRIINVSTDGASGFPAEISYGASKHALESYSRAAACELGKYGITVNVVSLGAIQTGWITAETGEKIIQTSGKEKQYWDEYSEIFVQRSYITKKMIKDFKEFTFNPEAIVAVLEQTKKLPLNIIEGLENSIELNNDNIIARAAYARAVMVQNGDLTSAWNILKQGIEKRKDSFYAVYVAARLRAQSGGKRRSLGILQKNEIAQKLLYARIRGNFILPE